MAGGLSAAQLFSGRHLALPLVGRRQQLGATPVLKPLKPHPTLCRAAVSKLQDIVQLDGVRSVGDARLTLELAISHAVPDSEQGCHVKRAILKCLLRRGLAASTSKGTFVQRSVHIAQLREEMKREAAASSLVAASISLYKKLSTAVRDFALGEQLVSIVTVATQTRHVVLRVRRLKQLREAARGTAPASNGAASIFSGKCSMLVQALP